MSAGEPLTREDIIKELLGTQWAYKASMSPHLCPVCQGKGIVPAGFYAATESGTLTSCAPEQCRACRGNGIIWG